MTAASSRRSLFDTRSDSWSLSNRLIFVNSHNLDISNLALIDSSGTQSISIRNTIRPSLESECQCPAKPRPMRSGFGTAQQDYDLYSTFLFNPTLNFRPFL